MKALTELPKRQSGALSRKPKSTRAGKQRPKISSILVPIDFSAPSMKALGYALDLAHEFHAHVTLLHVLEVLAAPEFATYPILPDADRIGEVKTRLARLLREKNGTANGMDAVKVRVGPPFKEIVRAAESLKADLIVIATHGYTGLAHVLLGSTAERVVRHARCPVLVVPART